jgi:meiotically up-regulated gene 157 (Mug157) protein
MFTIIKNDLNFANECNALAEDIEKALKQYATAQHLNYGEIIAFEVDGYGNCLFMDDANVPSLLALPYLGCINSSDTLYQNTRQFVLSTNNPWFFKGKIGEGIGGPHVGEEMIWPMSIIMQAMTSKSVKEISRCLYILKNTHAGTGFMHETFHMNNASNYTRSWFAWANTLFGELIIKITKEHPEILNEMI